MTSLNDFDVHGYRVHAQACSVNADGHPVTLDFFIALPDQEAAGRSLTQFTDAWIGVLTCLAPEGCPRTWDDEEHVVHVTKLRYSADLPPAELARAEQAGTSPARARKFLAYSAAQFLRSENLIP